MESVRKTLLVLETVAQMQPVGVAELSRALGFPKSSVQRFLQTLHSSGWIRPDGGEVTRWEITSKSVQLGRHFRMPPELREVALPVMQELREETDETIHLMVPDEDSMVLIERVVTRQSVRVDIPVGASMPMHSVANGKAYLAQLDTQAIDDYISRGLRRSTEWTITDGEDLKRELRRDRDLGFSVNRGEWRADVHAVAAAISGPGAMVGSLSISTPAVRMPEDSWGRFGALVSSAAQRISRNLA